jgi:hypothetical protein
MAYDLPGDGLATMYSCRIPVESAYSTLAIPLPYSCHSPTIQLNTEILKLYLIPVQMVPECLRELSKHSLRIVYDLTGDTHAALRFCSGPGVVLERFWRGHGQYQDYIPTIPLQLPYHSATVTSIRPLTKTRPVSHVNSYLNLVENGWTQRNN